MHEDEAPLSDLVNSNRGLSLNEGGAEPSGNALASAATRLTDQASAKRSDMPMNQEAYDLVVIGGGPAGTGGALAAAGPGDPGDGGGRG